VRLRFQRQVVRATAEAEDHLRNCEATLKAARGLFAASDSVVDADWRDFVESISLPEHNPAVHGLAFIHSVPPEALSDFTPAPGKAPEFEIGVKGDRLVAKDGAPASIAAKLDGIGASSHWKKLKSVKGGPAGIVAERKVDTQSGWLWDLWLCEKLAAK